MIPRILKVARTIADLDGSTNIHEQHIATKIKLVAKMRRKAKFSDPLKEIVLEAIAVELIVIFFLILANGFFSGSEHEHKVIENMLDFSHTQVS